MSKDFKVVFFGSDAKGERRIQVMNQVQRILKLREHHLLSLFDKPEGVDLYHTSDRSKAELLVSKLVHAGARAELVAGSCSTRPGVPTTYSTAGPATIPSDCP